MPDKAFQFQSNIKVEQGLELANETLPNIDFERFQSNIKVEQGLEKMITKAEEERARLSTVSIQHKSRARFRDIMERLCSVSYQVSIQHKSRARFRDPYQYGKGLLVGVSIQHKSRARFRERRYLRNTQLKRSVSIQHKSRARFRAIKNSETA